MRYWFTADNHFDHARILGYTKPPRPFADVDEMNHAMIERWNAVVKPGDRVFHLGDVAFAKLPRALEILKQLKGQKHLVFGNHDRYLREEKEFLAQFVWARDLTEIKVPDPSLVQGRNRGTQPIVLCHYAMRVWNKSHYGAWQLYGHSHNSLTDNPNARQCDVGVDAWNFTPVSYEQLKEVMAKKLWKPIDHHRGEYEE